MPAVKIVPTTKGINLLIVDDAQLHQRHFELMTRSIEGAKIFGFSNAEERKVAEFIARG